MLSIWHDEFLDDSSKLLFQQYAGQRPSSPLRPHPERMPGKTPTPPIHTHAHFIHTPHTHTSYTHTSYTHTSYTHLIHTHLIHTPHTHTPHTHTPHTHTSYTPHTHTPHTHTSHTHTPHTRTHTQTQQPPKAAPSTHAR